MKGVIPEIKRRTASQQAVNRKAEGIEPRNAFVGRDDVLSYTEVKMSSGVNGKPLLASPGSETMACWTLRMCGNPGDPESSYREVSMLDD